VLYRVLLQKEMGDVALMCGGRRPLASTRRAHRRADEHHLARGSRTGEGWCTVRTFDDFPGLATADGITKSVIELLELAIAQMKRVDDGHHTWSQRAELLGSAASNATEAAACLHAVGVWNAAAASASGAGVLDGRPTVGRTRKQPAKRPRAPGAR
jgi:hypothetical protein